MADWYRKRGFVARRGNQAAGGGSEEPDVLVGNDRPGDLPLWIECKERQDNYWLVEVWKQLCIECPKDEFPVLHYKRTSTGGGRKPLAWVTIPEGLWELLLDWCSTDLQENLEAIRVEDAKHGG